MQKHLISKEEHRLWRQTAVGSKSNHLVFLSLSECFFSLSVGFLVKTMRITLAAPEWGFEGLARIHTHDLYTRTLAHS